MATQSTSVRNTIEKQLHDLCSQLDIMHGQRVFESAGGLTLTLDFRKTDDGTACYCGTVFVRYPPGAEVDGIPWRLLDRNGDVVDHGVTDRGGHFLSQLPDVVAEDRPVYRLAFGRVPTVERKVVWTRAACEENLVLSSSMLSNKPRETEEGPIRLVGQWLWITVPAEAVPYGVITIAAIQRGQVIRALPLAMPLHERDGKQYGENRVHVRDLVGREDPDSFTFDARPVTEDPATRRHLNNHDVRQLLENCEDGKLRSDITRLLEKWTETENDQ